MNDIISVTQNGQTYALFVRRDMPVDGVKFLTAQDMPMQVGLMERPAGHEVKPHQHPPQHYDVRTMSEFLYVEKGKIRATVYDEEWKELGKHKLEAGDFLLFLRGGHRIEVLEDCRMVEVKQGPFPGDAASKVFRGQP